MRNQNISDIISNENEKQLIEKMSKIYGIINESYGEDRESYYSYVEELNKRKRHHWLAKRRIQKYIQSKSINSISQKFKRVSLVGYDEINPSFLKEHMSVRNKKINNELYMEKHDAEDYSVVNYSMKDISIDCLGGVC